MGQVPVIRTPLTADEARELIETAWAKRASVRPDVPPPTPERVRLLLALWDLETGTGGSQRNFNFGNQVATRESQDFYVADDAGNTRHFRAYPSGQAGAASFVAQLTSDTRPEWRDGLASGDPQFFVESLKGLHGGGFEYFEAPFEQYLQTFLGRWNRYDPKDLPPRRGIPSPAPQTPRKPKSGSGLVPLALLSGLGVYLYYSRVRRTRR